MKVLSKPRLLVVGGLTAFGAAALGGYGATHHGTALAASPAQIQLAAATAPAALTAPTAPTTPDATPEAPESTTPESGSAAAPEADGPGGHADNPNDPNADHQFDGVE